MKVKLALTILILSTFVFCMFVVAFSIFTYRLSPIPEIKVSQNSMEIILSEDIENYLETGELKLNINTATAEELQSIPGIGEVLSESIVLYRNEHGKFTNLEQLLNVDRIGEATLNNIKDYLYIE